jgi:hypothetical protein
MTLVLRFPSLPILFCESCALLVTQIFLQSKEYLTIRFVVEFSNSLDDLFSCVGCHLWILPSRGSSWDDPDADIL